MTKQNKIIAGIVAGTIAVAGSIAVLNTESKTETAIKHYPIKNMLGVNVHHYSDGSTQSFK